MWRHKHPKPAIRAKLRVSASATAQQRWKNLRLATDKNHISVGKTKRLTSAKPLLPGDVLISDGGVFALGFFSLKNSMLSSYVGIWYNNIPERTYVWIANRNNPLTTNLPGKLVFTNSSDLVLLDSTGHALWTTTNNITTRNDGAAAILLNSGNLVVRLPNGTDIWESFHYPTDTIVPNVSFSLSSTDIARRLVAWKGPNDPSSSDFSMGGDSDFQIVVWNRTKPYWRRPALGGNVISGSFQSNTTFVMYQSTVDTGNGYYMKMTVDGSPNVRLTLDYTGMVSFRWWNSATSSWTVFNQFPSPFCDQYAFCGPFAYCDDTESVPTCKCLDGFEPDNLNLSRGCRRQEELKCGGEVDRSRCLVWTGVLIDTKKFSNGFGENLYLRYPSTSASKKSTLLKIILPSTVSLLLLLACIWIGCKRKSKGNYQGKKTQYSHTLQEVSNKLGNESLEYPSISLEDIITATNNFSYYNMLGKGGFGKVYKGMLEGGKEVAVKRLSKTSTQGVEEFRNEVVLIAKLQHRNLLGCLPFCGYMSPEYAMEGSFSVKSDTYSFGVLLLEIVSGLKISSPNLIMDFPNLIAFAWSLWKDGKAMELVDSSVVDSCSCHEALRCIHLALICVQDQPNARPLMSSIVFMLENEAVSLPTPKQPVFFTRIRNSESDQSNEYIRRSLNNMTITTIEGR
ncbi:hypothetical protein QOZ80_4BG0333620 [Eleusine coracana subsp. coracana]|nr:hypothetical protein QOZ80_4BG0333620 [Eleusine coracana subsp. coracana]